MKFDGVHRCPAGNHPVFLYANGTIVPHYHDDGTPCRANGQQFTEPPATADLAEEIARDLHWHGVEDRVRVIAGAMRDYAEVLMREAETRFAEHTKAVSGFLSEMHATMVDPLADGQIPVKEMCELLLKRARQDREALTRFDAALRPFADRSKHYREKYGWHARTGDTVVVTLGECDAASAALGDGKELPDRPRILCTELDGQQME